MADTTPAAGGLVPPASTRPVGVLDLRRSLTTWQAIVVRLLALATFALLWEWGATAADSILIPTFIETMQALYQTAFVTGEIWASLWVSNVPLVLGFIIAAVVSVPLGLAMARWKALDRAMNPVTALGLALPIGPLSPVILVALGLGLTSRTVVVFLFAWVFIVVNVRAGARRVDKILVEMAQSYGASERQVWFRILVPASIPAVFSALRIGLGRAFAGMVIVELIMLPLGVGALLLEYRGEFKAGLLYATTILVMLEAVILALVVQAVERRLGQWR